MRQDSGEKRDLVQAQELTRGGCEEWKAVEVVSEPDSGIRITIEGDELGMNDCLRLLSWHGKAFVLSDVRGKREEDGKFTGHVTFSPASQCFLYQRADGEMIRADGTQVCDCDLEADDA